MALRAKLGMVTAVKKRRKGPSSTPKPRASTATKDKRDAFAGVAELAAHNLERKKALTGKPGGRRRLFK